MRDRLLVRHFLQRFLEHDLSSPNADRREVMSVAGGTLIALSLFTTVFVATPYVFDNSMPPGILSVRSIDDRFFFTSASMLVMALLVVALWDSLELDARDASVLGVLPIPRSVIMRTKFIAVAAFAVATLTGWNLIPTLLRFVAMPSASPVSLTGVVQLTLAHGATTFAAGAFGFLAVLGSRQAMLAVLGRSRFRLISAVLQTALIVVFTTALLLLPGASRSVARGWLDGDGLSAKVLPSSWFVGLHETLAGSVIDNLPRNRVPRFLVNDEREATSLYRKLRPLFRELAPMAIAALPAVSLLTVFACFWTSRRLPAPSVRRVGNPRPLNRAWMWIVVHAVARTSVRQAGFFFTLQTLSRQVSHRVALASSAALGLALILVTSGGQITTHGADIGAVPVAILAAQPLLLLCVLSGFRQATRLPAELRASPTFSLASMRNTRHYMSGVKRAGWIALALPTLGGLFLLQIFVLGVHAASAHLFVGLAFSVLVTESLFVRYRLLPFVSAYVPSTELKSRGIVYVVAILLVAFAVAWLERSVLSRPVGYLMLSATCLGLSLLVMMFDRTWQRPAFLLQEDEAPPLPTQRLNLAR